MAADRKEFKVESQSELHEFRSGFNGSTIVFNKYTQSLLAIEMGNKAKQNKYPPCLWMIKEENNHQKFSSSFGLRIYCAFRSAKYRRRGAIYYLEAAIELSKNGHWVPVTDHPHYLDFRNPMKDSVEIYTPGKIAHNIESLLSFLKEPSNVIKLFARYTYDWNYQNSRRGEWHYDKNVEEAIRAHAAQMTEENLIKPTRDQQSVKIRTGNCPQAILCKGTSEIMENPYTSQDGEDTYEKEEFSKWRKGTGFLNHVLRNAIEKFKDSNFDALAEELECPITYQRFVDPVCTVDGYTYSRKAIEEWFSKGNSTSPLTGVKLDSTKIVSNRALSNFTKQLDAYMLQLGIQESNDSSLKKAGPALVSNSLLRGSDDREKKKEQSSSTIALGPK